MNKLIIKGYIDNIGINDVLRFASSNGISITDDEASVLIHYLKNNWMDLLYGDPYPIINDMKNKLGPYKTELISSLYFLYKEKYKDYL